MLDESLGADWRDEYVVWDCASGTNNLTRDFQFKELYCSTLEQGDINTVKDCGYNRGSTVFQYDFLNDDEVDVLGAKIPEGLRKAFESGKKILFLINPPYGKSAGIGMVEKNVSKTVVSSIMKANNMGKCSEQLYAAFLYKISQLNLKYKNLSLALFCPPLFVSGNSFDKVRKEFLQGFSFSNGMLLNAANFSDVSSGMEWGIAFTIWKHGAENNNGDEISLSVKEVNNFKINTIANKVIYRARNDAQKWCKIGIPTEKIPHLTLKSYATVEYGELTFDYDKMAIGAIGFFHNNCNSVYYNTSFVGLYSQPRDTSNGFSIMPINFNHCIALFCARKSITPTWINCKDEYMVPNIDHPEYAQWNADAIVYSLFNNSSQQSALRDINYKGKKWNIQNTFFFMSNKEMRELADKAGFMEMYEDAKSFPNDSYVYTLLQSTKLSDDTKAILENAKDLMKQSMSLREAYAQEHPELHLKSWNAGWAQLKPLLKQHFKPQYDAFVIRYKAFEARMREGVYKFGFLK